MKKISGFLVTVTAVAALSACSWELPQCHDELDKCGRDTAYTEERTAKAGKRMAVKPRPEPVVQAPQPAPEPAPAPAPEPEPVVHVQPDPPPPLPADHDMMGSAEPMVQHISK